MAVERTPVTVEARFAPEGTITPTAIVEGGRRRAIAAVGRQWDERSAERGPQRFFDVQMPGGETLLLCLERRTLRWTVVGARGLARMA